MGIYGFDGYIKFNGWRAGQIDTLILLPAIKRSERYRKLKMPSFDEDKVLEIFNTPVPMSIFSYFP